MRKELQSLSLASEQSFQKETLHWHWFVKMYADDPGKPKSLVFKHINKNKLCPCVNAYQESTVLGTDEMPGFLLPLSQAQNNQKIKFTRWLLLRFHLKHLYNSSVLPTPTYSCIISHAQHCKIPCLSLFWNVKVYATWDMLFQACWVIHTMMNSYYDGSTPGHSEYANN